MKQPNPWELMERLTEWQFQQWMAWFEWRHAVQSGHEKVEQPPPVRIKLSAEETIRHLLGQMNRRE